MHNITLVCSVHRENGACNPGELLKILRVLEPEAVFEEIRPSAFEFLCKHGISLESQAVTRYLEFKSSRRVPVDRYEMPENLMAEMKEVDSVFEYVIRTSREYQLLSEENDRSVRQHGFSYLNSFAFETVRARMLEIEEKTINETDDQGLIRGLERWRRLMRRREQEMVGVIYQYCRENAFNKGVFLVGAAHKMGIVKEVQKYASGEADLIDWKLCL